MRFYLGTHEPHWLSMARVPLFISAVRLRQRCKRKLPRARVPWALDSGGFSVIKGSEGYPQSPEEYAAEVKRWSERIGLLEWAAVQDWMCEPVKLKATGFTVEEHQRRTVQSWCDLKRIAPDVNWLPVLQGYTRDEYLRCVKLYADAGTDLTALPVVGIGSICRRQDTRGAEMIVRELAGLGIRLHGFGFKLGGLERCREYLVSADSLAWSDGARRRDNARRKHQKRMNRMGSLFDVGPVVVEKTKSSDPRTALNWLRAVEARAGLKDEPQLVHPCPFCSSADVRPPVSSEREWCCVECGASWDGTGFEDAT